MNITLGFSPCPNDTFIFDALVNKKIDTQNFNFDVQLGDVQQLNEWAIVGKLDCTKISYGVLPQITHQYLVLNSGSALGNGVGPLLISNQPQNNDVNMQVIAIPGQNTTAHALFTYAYPKATNKIFLPYHQIENFVATGQGLGVIIHENRFTYQQKGLHKILDLGAYWEQQQQQPIPLGGIVGKKSLNIEVLQQIDALIHQSITYAFEHSYKNLPNYVQTHSQEMSETVMRQHIDLYVNQYSVNLGAKGKAAIIHLTKHLGLTNTAIFI
jgi:1,4-dihydroxy-6-naphthoate synthase